MEPDPITKFKERYATKPKTNNNVLFTPKKETPLKTVQQSVPQTKTVFVDPNVYGDKHKQIEASIIRVLEKHGQNMGLTDLEMKLLAIKQDYLKKELWMVIKHLEDHCVIQRKKLSGQEMGFRFVPESDRVIKISPTVEAKIEDIKKDDGYWPNTEDAVTSAESGMKPVLKRTIRNTTDDEFVEYIRRHKPMTATVAAWVNSSYPTTVLRLSKLKNDGRILRKSKMSPWIVNPNYKGFVIEVMNSYPKEVPSILSAKDQDVQLVSTGSNTLLYKLEMNGTLTVGGTEHQSGFKLTRAEIPYLTEILMQVCDMNK